ncbi:GIY-YIG nuclease family protein [Clostridium sp. HBUAS56010]|uniref:GIY-YIG nuclease family protein n=1 Tax=Clostridium sp. HBUAS56010 TaxID=2571127 RepID=UPI001177CAF2|nr:GIY-YIG nuclease family protein [Clostridium sp. HBUAS56010]
MNEKIAIDERIEEHQRGIYGIFILSCNGNCKEQCAYIGKSEELCTRVKNHYNSIQNQTHISTLNNVMDDEETRIEIRLVEPVPYIFDNYYKDAQRLASRENYWIDKYQEIDQCLEQVPEGKRPSIVRWEQLKAESSK